MAQITRHEDARLARLERMLLIPASVSVAGWSPLRAVVIAMTGLSVSRCSAGDRPGSMPVRSPVCFGLRLLVPDNFRVRIA